LNAELQVLKQKLKEGEWSKVVNRRGKPRSWSDVVFTNNSLQETRNRFSALQEVSETPQVVRKPVEKVVKGKSKKKKVLLLSCSQGHLCSNLLQENLGDNFEVSSIVKPNVRLKDVVCDAEKLVEGFGESDCLIVLGGSNDMDGKYKETILQGLSKVLPLAKKTNIIFNPVPTRFDRFDLKDPVSNANQIISSQVTRYPDRKTWKIRINTGIERLNRDCYTRHGLHLNRRSKTELCSMWSKLVIDCVCNSNIFLDQTGESRKVK